MGHAEFSLLSGSMIHWPAESMCVLSPAPSFSLLHDAEFVS